jgi:hypothetical protein
MILVSYKILKQLLFASQNYYHPKSIRFVFNEIMVISVPSLNLLLLALECKKKASLNRHQVEIT